MRNVLSRVRAWLLAGVAAGAALPSLALDVALDRFTVVRNDRTIFDDTFADGLLPPSAPDFLFGGPAPVPASYSVFGNLPAGTESGGVLNIDSANGGLSGNAVSEPRLVTSALLLTSTTGGLTQLGTGDTLSVSALFNLTVPTGPTFAAYGVRFTDANAGAVHQFAQLFVGFNEVTASPYIAYVLQDFDADTVTVLGSLGLVPPVAADQVRLTIYRPDAANDEFFGNVDYLIGGVVNAGVAFNNPAELFQGESFVRGQFFVAQGIAAPVPEPEIVLLFGVGGTFLWAARRRAKRLAS